MKNEVSCINTRAILDYVRKNYNGDYKNIIKNLDPEIDALHDPEGFLSDKNNWVSCTVISRLWERVRTIFNDEMIAYKVAKYNIENTSMGYAQRIIVKGFWSCRRAARHVQRINDKWNRSKKVEAVEVKRNSAIIRLHWDSKMDLSKDLCLMNQGMYTFLPLIWGGKPIQFKEACCYFDGAPYCEYHLRFPARNRLHEIFSRFITSRSVLEETVKEMETDKKVIEEKYEEVNRLNVKLNQKIRQLLAIQDTGKAILSILDLNQLLTVIMNLLSNVCRINRAIIMLANEKERCLEYMYCAGFEGDVPENVRNYKVSLDRLSNILVRVANSGRAEYIPQVSSSNLRKENIILMCGNPVAVYVVPLITRSKVIGVIATDGIEGEGVPKETRDTLEIFASQIAIAIENARLYSILQGQMKELRRSRALLSRAEKFSFLGNLAARLAHEIKNPMTAIGTFIQMLPQRYEDEEFRNEFHEIALEETNRVNNMITELLDLVRKREPSFELNDIHGLIDKMVLLISPQSNSKKIKVIRQFDPEIRQVWLDSEKIKQVVLNLLSNAVEFTPEGGIIELITKKSNENGKCGNIIIEVKDNGIGIPLAMIEKIFDPYFTTKNQGNAQNGIGLGLFIAHQNMEDHGGTIEVKSEVNEGTTFIITLPLKPCQGSSHYEA